MQIHRQDGVCVRYRTVGDSDIGVMEVAYAGLISASVFADLWLQQIKRTKAAPAVLVRLDRACLVFDEMPEPPCWSQPAAIVVRDDQQPFAQDYARKCAEARILRVIFSPEQAEAAFEWAEEFGRANIEQPRSWRRRRPESDFAPLVFCLAFLQACGPGLTAWVPILA